MPTVLPSRHATASAGRWFLTAAVVAAVLTSCSTGSDGPSASTTVTTTVTATPRDAESSAAAADLEPASSPIEFRRVIASAVAPAVGKVEPAAEELFTTYTCGQPPVATQEGGLVTCDAEGIKYLLGVSEISADVDAATAALVGVAWVVDVKLGPSAAQKLADLSRELVGTGREVAFCVDGTVLFAPIFDGVITDGILQVSGDFDQESAQQLATKLAPAG